MCLLQQKKCAEECHRNKFDKSSGQQLLLVQHFVKVYKGSEDLEKNTKQSHSKMLMFVDNYILIIFEQITNCKKVAYLHASKS